jgi:hypothetical protein
MSGKCPTRVTSLAQTIRSLQTWWLQFVPKFLPKTTPKPAPKPPAKGDAQGKKKKHVQQFTMRSSLTKKGFISEPVDP